MERSPGSPRRHGPGTREPHVSAQHMAGTFPAGGQPAHPHHSSGWGSCLRPAAQLSADPRSLPRELQPRTLPASRATGTLLAGTTRSLLSHPAGGSRGTLTAGEGAWQRAGLPAVPWGPQRGQPLSLGVPSARAAPAPMSLGVGSRELRQPGQAPAKLGHTGHVPTERCWGTGQSWAAWGRAWGRCQPRCPGGCLL